LVWGHGIEYYLDYILFNPVASTTQKWWKLKLLRWAKLLNRLVDLDEILYGDDNIENDLDSMLRNPVASTISKWRTFKLLTSLHLLNRLVDSDEILYCGNGIKVDLDHSKMAVCLSQ
jgi:hypothetical protein